MATKPLPFKRGTAYALMKDGIQIWPPPNIGQTTEQYLPNPKWFKPVKRRKARKKAGA